LGNLLLSYDMSNSYPSSLRPLTVSYCTFGDIMCDPDVINLDFGYMTGIHTGYSAATLSALGHAGAAIFYPTPTY
jgi:hypothetical protein